MRSCKKRQIRLALLRELGYFANMSTIDFASTAGGNLKGLIAAIARAPEEDGLGNTLSQAQWGILASYLQSVDLPAGQVLFAEGSNDRTLYLVERGSLSVHYQDAKERVRLAVVGSGSIVGEGAFFSHRPRSATVQAGAACRLWALAPLRFAELSNRQPSVALALVMAVGGVLARRLANRRMRVATT